MYWAGLNLEQLAYAVLLVGLAVYAWRALGAAYGIFALGSLALPFSDPVPDLPLLSMPALRARHLPGLHRPGPARSPATRGTRRSRSTFTLLLGINLARWVMWIWVA